MLAAPLPSRQIQLAPLITAVRAHVTAESAVGKSPTSRRRVGLRRPASNGPNAALNAGRACPLSSAGCRPAVSRRLPTADSEPIAGPRRTRAGPVGAEEAQETRRGRRKRRERRTWGTRDVCSEPNAAADTLCAQSGGVTRPVGRATGPRAAQHRLRAQLSASPSPQIVSNAQEVRRHDSGGFIGGEPSRLQRRRDVRALMEPALRCRAATPKAAWGSTSRRSRRSRTLPLPHRRNPASPT